MPAKPLLLLVDDDAQIRVLLTEGDVARALAERPAAAAPDDERAGPPPTAAEIRAAMDVAGGNKALAARRLGLSRRKLYRRIDKYAASPS